MDRIQLIDNSAHLFRLQKEEVTALSTHVKIKFFFLDYFWGEVYA